MKQSKLEYFRTKLAYHLDRFAYYWEQENQARAKYQTEKIAYCERRIAELEEAGE